MKYREQFIKIQLTHARLQSGEGLLRYNKTTDGFGNNDDQSGHAQVLLRQRFPRRH